MTLIGFVGNSIGYLPQVGIMCRQPVNKPRLDSEGGATDKTNLEPLCSACPASPHAPPTLLWQLGNAIGSYLTLYSAVRAIHPSLNHLIYQHASSSYRKEWPADANWLFDMPWPTPKM